MRKTYVIFGLLLFLVVLFSIDMLFGNIIMETFRSRSQMGLPNGLKSGSNSSSSSSKYSNVSLSQDDQPSLPMR